MPQVRLPRVLASLVCPPSLDDGGVLAVHTKSGDRRQESGDDGDAASSKLKCERGRDPVFCAMPT